MKRLKHIIPVAGFSTYLIYLANRNNEVVNNTSFQLAVFFCLTCILLTIGERMILSKAALIITALLFIVSFILLLLFQLPLSIPLFLGAMMMIQLFKKYSARGRKSLHEQKVKL